MQTFVFVRLQVFFEEVIGRSGFGWLFLLLYVVDIVDDVLGMVVIGRDVPIGRDVSFVLLVEREVGNVVGRVFGLGSLVRVVEVGIFGGTLVFLRDRPGHEILVVLLQFRYILFYQKTVVLQVVRDLLLFLDRLSRGIEVQLA